MGISKNRGIPKWMVYNGNPIKMDDLGGNPLFLETTPTIFHTSPGIFCPKKAKASPLRRQPIRSLLVFLPLVLAEIRSQCLKILLAPEIWKNEGHLAMIKRGFKYNWAFRNMYVLLLQT